MITVSTPATKFNLVDVSLVRAALDVDQGEEAQLSPMIDRASDVIARRCKRVFALETVVETIRRELWGDGELILARYPVVGAVAIVENGVTLTASTDYEIDNATGIITRITNDRPAYWPTCKIAITYAAGYDLPGDAPPALAQACIQLVKSYYVGADRDPMIRSETVDALSSASFFDGELPPEVAGLIAPFRNIRVR
jgi:hypothetical protein